VIQASAPGRAGIIGNPTDMYGGCVLSCSIGERAYCSLLPSEQSYIAVGDDVIYLENTESLNLDGGKFDLAKAALQAFEVDPTAEKFGMRVRTDIPEQAGLAGSTAMLASIVGCLIEYLGLDLTKYEIAETVREIEANIMGITCGYQDQYMTVFGGLNFMDFTGKEYMGGLIPEPFATVEPLSDIVPELPMLVAHTGVKRFSGSVHKGLRERWLGGEEKVVKGYQRIAELGRLGKKALVTRDWKTLGELMNENHAIQRDLGGSSECNERLIEAALAHGALGAKLAGAGHGGTVIILTEDVEAMRKALQSIGVDKIILPRPAEGLIIERMWQVDYHEQGTSTDRFCRWMDRR
jgi:galactokinase/mevalonate kinase-like predicted kinase